MKRSQVAVGANEDSLATYRDAVLNWLVVDLLRVAHHMRAHGSRC